MYRDAELRVRCGSCGSEVGVGETDLVPSGTGYQCRRCATVNQITGHLLQSERSAREARGLGAAAYRRFGLYAALFLLSLVLSAARSC